MILLTGRERTRTKSRGDECHGLRNMVGNEEEYLLDQLTAQLGRSPHGAVRVQNIRGLKYPLCATDLVKETIP